MKIYHIAPSDIKVTGIASYADLFDSALKKYYGNCIDLIRMDPLHNDLSSLRVDDDGICLFEIGINDGVIFRLLRNNAFKKKQRIITIHDPPKVTNCPYGLFESFNSNKFLRALRRGLNTLLLDSVLKKTFFVSDRFICLNPNGANVLKKRLDRIGFQNISVSFIPLLNYLDPCISPMVSVSSKLKIGQFGFLSQDKGIHFLVDAAIAIKEMYGAQYVPDIEICGKTVNSEADIYVSNLKEKIRLAGLEKCIKINGFVENDRLPEFIKSIDIIALPYTNGLTYAASGPAQWARTIGKPLLVSKTPVGLSVVNDAIDGFIVNNTKEDWAEAIYRISKDKSELFKLVDGIKKRQVSSSWEVVTRSFVNLVSN